jgi:putative ABC transport system permease protein
MWLARLWQDLRHGCRLFVKTPGFTAIAVISIACGTGANVAMFSTVDALLLRPLPVDRASALITVGTRQADSVGEIISASYPDYVDVRARTQTLTSLVAFHSRRAGISINPAAPPHVRLVTAVSGNFFADLGIGLQLGRGFLPGEDRVPGRDPVAVLSDSLWKQAFGRDPAVIGRTLLIAGTTYTVVGVADESFTGIEQVMARESAYVPLAMWPQLMNTPDMDPLTTRDLRILKVKGRLRGDATLAEARAELAVLAKGLEREHPDTNAGRALIAQTEFQARVASGPVVAPLLLVLSMLALAVLGVACANVAGLLTSRAPLRARELGVRLAIGAGRARLVAQLLAESLTIALAGGIGGIAVGYAGIALIGQIEFPTDIFALPAIEMNRRALAFSIALAAASAVVFGLGPALSATRIDLSSAVRVAEPANRRRWRLTGRNSLVAIQVALSLAVLTVATIALQTFADALGRGPGFRTTRMAKITIDASEAHYTGTDAAAFFDRVVEEARLVPGVTSASVTSAMPLWDFELAKVERRAGDAMAGEWSAAPFANVVDEHYLDTMEIPLVRGRGFQHTDAAGTPLVAIVNETMARRYWPGEEAVGRYLVMGGPLAGSVEVVGVARNSLYLYPAEPPQNMLYLPMRQHPRGIMVLLAQTAGPSEGPLPALRDVVRRVDAAVPVYDAQTIEQFYDAIAVSIASVILSLISGIGLMGIAITVIGLYGLVSYAVNRRTREIGIRVAVGASYARIMRLLLRQGLTPVWVGMGAGVLLSIGAARLLPAVAPFSQTYDTWALAALVPALFLVTLLAAFVPARRAATVNPIVALRDE